jgi:hypothetical protein
MSLTSKHPRVTGFSQLLGAVISTVDHPLGSPSLLTMHAYKVDP